MRGVILAIGILVICAAVSYSFEDLTGFIFRGPEYTSLVVTPYQVCEGRDITVYINPGNPSGAEKFFTVHRENGIRKGRKNWCSQAQGACHSSKEECKDTSFKCNMIKSVKTNEAITIFLGNDNPTKVEFDVAQSQGHVTYLLAPRIESE